MKVRCDSLHFLLFFLEFNCMKNEIHSQGGNVGRSSQMCNDWMVVQNSSSNICGFLDLIPGKETVMASILKAE